MLDLTKLAVLVVEDEPDFRLLSGEMLKDVGIRNPVLVESPMEALVRLQQEPFDVLLSDLRLGKESGVRLIQRMRAVSPSTRAILMSAYATARDVEEATALGAVAVLNKPFQSEQLELALRRAAAAADGLWGQVHDLSLIDMLQMYHYGKRSVAVALKGPPDGRILMHEGELVDAEFGELSGVEALRRLLPVRTGVVRTEALGEIHRHSISGEFEAVVLDCLRAIDEDGRPSDLPSEALDLEMEMAFASFAAEISSTTEIRGLNGSSEVAHAQQVLQYPRGGTSRTLDDLQTRGEKTMATEKQLQETLAKIQSEITGLFGASVVDLETGMTLAVLSARADFDLSTASAYNSEMVKMKLKTMKALNIKSSLEDMLLTLGDQIHLIKLITPTTFIYLAADKSSTNLAIVRSAVAKQISNLQ